MVVAETAKTVDFEARDRHKSELARTSFWLPSVQPEAAKKIPPCPPRRPPSPITGAELRAKDLVALDLRRSDVAKASQNANDGTDTRFLCHVSGDEITTQGVLLIKSTGCIVTEPVAERLNVLKEKRCPVTGAAFRDKDVVKLKTGVSGYRGRADILPVGPDFARTSRVRPRRSGRPAGTRPRAAPRSRSRCTARTGAARSLGRRVSSILFVFMGILRRRADGSWRVGRSHGNGAAAAQFVVHA